MNKDALVQTNLENLHTFQIDGELLVDDYGTTLGSEAYNYSSVTSQSEKYFTLLDDFSATITYTDSPTTSASLGQSTICSTPSVSGADVYFQMTNNGMDWYFFNVDTGKWESSTTICAPGDIPSQSNTWLEVKKNIKQFIYDVDAGVINFRAFFVGVGGIYPRLHNVHIRGKQYYTTIKKIRALLEQVGIRDYDPVSGNLRNNSVMDFLSDEKLETWLPLGDAFINDYCFRDFYLHENVFEYHDGNNSNSLVARYFPIHRVHRIVMFNQLLQHMRTYTENELIIHPEWGEIFLPPVYPSMLGDKPTRAIFGNIFISGKRNVEVVYDYGYEVTPPAIEFAARKWAAIQTLNAYWLWLTKGVQSRSVAGYSESYFGRPWGDTMEQWFKEITDVLNKHRRYSGGLRGI